MNKQEWINDIIRAGNNLPPAPVNPFLATRIEAKLNALQEKGTKSVIPVRWVYASAVAMMVLLLLNIALLRSWGGQAKEGSGIQQVMSEYGFNTNDLYTMNYPK